MLFSTFVIQPFSTDFNKTQRKQDMQITAKKFDKLAREVFAPVQLN
jgi:hypothetical protein